MLETKVVSCHLSGWTEERKKKENKRKKLSG
jgi:hypothetical protein